MILMQDRTGTEIRLTSQNIDDIKESDIIAWTLAHPGAMGRPGAITIITIRGNAMWLYIFNYVQNESLKVSA